MTSYPHLSKAPIAEAVLDIRVEVADEEIQQQIESFHEKIKGEYPEKKKKNTIQAHVDLEEKSVTSRNDVTGFQFFSQDGKNVFQVDLDGVTVNRLKPYEDWGTFLTRAKKLWEMYQQGFQITKIKRLALRYINHIPVKRGEDMDDYFTAPPRIPKDLPQVIAGYFSKTVFRNENKKIIGQVTQTSFESSPDCFSAILDIETIRTYEDNQGVNIWDDFEELREFKNRIFFASITDKTKGMLT